MKKNNKDTFVGVFDSGLGGLSVLEEMLNVLPNEDFVYFGDSKNAPYGTKSKEEILELTTKNVLMLKEKGAKAVVLACNTATSVAAAHLRKTYNNLPIIGVEPAIKPAVLENKGKRIVVMATPATIKGRQYLELVNKYKDDAELIPMPCEGLMEFVERGELTGKKLQKYLELKLKTEMDKGISVIVLGCTHYPFIKKEIINLVGKDVKIYDGSLGTAKQLKRILQANGICKDMGDAHIEILNSGGEEFVERSKKLLDLKIWREGL